MIGFAVALGICLVALAVALNVGWIILNWRQSVMLFLGVIFCGDHPRHDFEHGVPGARDPAQ